MPSYTPSTTTASLPRPALLVAGLLVFPVLSGGGRGAAAEGTSDLWVWSPNPLVSVFKEGHYRDRAETDCAIRLVGTRNGVASGQVVVCAAAPVQILGASASDLRSTSADATIPAAAAQVRYALPTGRDRYAAILLPGVRQPNRFDALSPAPGEAAAIQPVWVTVTVPREARPGEYAGRLTIRLADRPSLTVRIRLTACGWVAPDPQAFRTHVGFVQSPDSLALQYQVPLWSERHFDLVARSFRYLGQVGNKTLYLPLLAQTHFGNEQSLVRWIRKDDGTFAHDFSVLERYVDLYLKHAVKPEVVCLYVWDYGVGGAWWGDEAKRQTPQPVPVSRLDPETGAVEVMRGPVHGSPESYAFWKPVMDGVRERLLKRGFSEEAILLGIGGDKRPDKDTVELFKTIAPYARWVSNSHGKILAIQGVAVGYLAQVWGVGAVPPPEVKRNYGWKQDLPITVFPRYGGGKFVIHPNLSANAPLAVYRNICEGATLANLRGIGRVGADFWPVIPGPREKTSVLNRYPGATWGQLTISNAVAEVLYPGPDGPISTVRFEMLREGLLEAEARISIERALTSPDLRRRLGDDLANRCQALLDERVRAYLRAHGDIATAGETTRWYAESDWQTRTAQLFAAAADVAAATWTSEKPTGSDGSAPAAGPSSTRADAGAPPAPRP